MDFWQYLVISAPQSICSLQSLKHRKKLSGGGLDSWGLAYESIISVDNLLGAWQEFKRGKNKRADILEFERHLMQNILNLHHELAAGTYRHGGYEHFRISDPKPRDIHKASVRDRLVHHAIYRVLYPFFDRTFISDSYSCRLGKGTHRAMNTFRRYAYRASKNHTKTLWVLKCDIRKFFASIDQKVLIEVVGRYLPDERVRALVANVVASFCATPGVAHTGLPLGNLTSQLLVNIYLNEFDQYVKHKLKVKYYIRYADDFAILSTHKNYLLETLPYMVVFLRDTLKLEMHPHKVSIQTLTSGVDFLGWVHFPDHHVLRTATKKRMFRTLNNSGEKPEVLNSYLGMLKHGNSSKLRQQCCSLTGDNAHIRIG